MAFKDGMLALSKTVKYGGYAIAALVAATCIVNLFQGWDLNDASLPLVYGLFFAGVGKLVSWILESFVK